jgi:predicted metallopeptidase
VEIDYPARRAVIQVLDPVDHRLPEDQMLALVESVVVHELVHISLTPVVGALRCVESTDSEEERAVRHITAALLAAQKNGHI